MYKYNPVTPQIIAELATLLGEKNVTTDQDKLYTYSHDEVTEERYHHLPEVVVFPETTAQVAAVVKLANRELIPVTPRGAGTGLACGAVPNCSGIVLSTEKMNKILEINQSSMYMVAEAGARTEDVQQLAKQHGLLYAGDPCSGDSCFIGGNVATNAGGNKAVKYGTTRHQVYAVEVVTPKGDITTLGARLNKSSTGYNLDQLIIGSEGTLGIITKVTLKLVPLPQCSADFLAVFPSADAAINFVSVLAKAGITPTTMEFMDTVAIHCSESFINEKLPHNDGNYLIIQIEADNDEELEDIAVQLDELCTEHAATTLLMLNDSAKIWKARKSFAEAVRHETLIHSNEDIVVPIDKLPEAMRYMSGICEKHGAAARTVSHAGDGNIHISILQGNIPLEQWPDTLYKIQTEIFDFVYPLGGKLSGEHGIGYKKKSLMQAYTDPVELDMMRSIKLALDPNWILNPDKLFDRPEA